MYLLSIDPTMTFHIFEFYEEMGFNKSSGTDGNVDKNFEH